jgi:NAD(P)-dependent dehydrogenase (short-subunit alcohol dehydrogenase family)
MAEGLAHGASLILNGRNASTLEIAADRLREKGLKAQSIAVDVADYRAVADAIQSVVTNHHRLEILIANAGIIPSRAACRLERRKLEMTFLQPTLKPASFWLNSDDLAGKFGDYDAAGPLSSARLIHRHQDSAIAS